MVMITDSLFSSQSKPFHSMVRDYAKCLPQQKSPDPKIFCDALIFAVDHGKQLSVAPIMHGSQLLFIMN